MMPKHILSMESVDSLVSRVAADVNHDHSIVVIDILAIQKVIFGMMNYYASRVYPNLRRTGVGWMPHRGTLGPGIAGGG